MQASKGSNLNLLLNLDAGNGVVYVLDSVLAMLPNVVEAVEEAPNLKTFYRALNSSGVGATLGGNCPSPADGKCTVTGVTVLAPTNAAFASLAHDQKMTVNQLLALPQVRVTQFRLVV